MSILVTVLWRCSASEGMYWSQMYTFTAFYFAIAMNSLKQLLKYWQFDKASCVRKW